MVAVAASLCNGGIVRTEPRSESRPRRSSWGPAPRRGLGRQLRAAASARSASSCPLGSWS